MKQKLLCALVLWPVIATSSCSSDGVTAESKSQYSDKQWRELQEYAGTLDVDQIRVTKVREAGPEEQDELVAQCLRDKGWSGAHSKGGVGGMIPTDRMADYERDAYTCFAAYPVKDNYIEDWTPENLGKQFDYLTTTYTACVKTLGYTVEQPPSRETFIAQSGARRSPAWNPLNAALEERLKLMKEGHDFPDPHGLELDKKCPPTYLLHQATLDGQKTTE